MTTLLVQSPEPTESWEENQVYKVVFLSPHANHGTCAPLPASYMYPITRNFKIFKVAVNPRQFEISDSYPISDSDSQFCPSIYLHIIWSSDEKQHPSFLSASEVNCGCQYHQTKKCLDSNHSSGCACEGFPETTRPQGFCSASFQILSSDFHDMWSHYGPKTTAQ